MKEVFPIVSLRFLLAAFLVGGIVSSSHALAIVPARTEIHLGLGKKAAAELTATNDDKVDIQVTVSKKDWFIAPANKGITVDQWLTVHGPSQFMLKPGEARKIKLTVKCPKNVEGELVGMVSFLYQAGVKSMVTPMISVSMYVIAAGHEKMEGHVKEMVVRKYHDQWVVSAVVSSTGNVHLRPSGKLVIANPDGTTVASVPIPEGTPTYPGMDGLYSGQFPAAVQLSSGAYVARADLAYQGLLLEGSSPFKILQDGQIQMSPLK